MSKEELIEIFNWVEKELNYNKLLYFRLDDNNQISGYFKSNNKRFCQIYINRIKELMKTNRGD